MTVIDDILVGVLADLAERKARLPLGELRRIVTAEMTRPALDPLPALRAHGLSVIAEVKRASPSKGPLAGIADPASLAAEYEAGGAAAVSVLTERHRFGGSLDDLDAVRQRVSLPVLRKDFMVDQYQVWEARRHGADMVLLIVAALTDAELRLLKGVADSLGMTSLVEVHTPDEVERANALGATLIGVNNRNLKTLEVDLAMFAQLAPLVRSDAVKVAESGILSPVDAAAAAAAGADAVLVGETLVKDARPRQAVADLIAAGSAARR